MKNVRAGIVYKFITHVLDVCKVSNPAYPTPSLSDTMPSIGLHGIWWGPRLLIPAHADPDPVSAAT